MTTIYRPVEASPPQMNVSVIDPQTGKFTIYGHRIITELWKRTGGFTDDIGAMLGLVTLSQTSSLTAASGEERTRRELGDALQQMQAQNTERLRTVFDDYRKTSDAQFSQLLGGLARPPQTRVITFTQNDTWRLNPDVRAIQVILVGAGGAGGGGSPTTSGAGGGGGAGGGYSTAYFNAAELPASVSVTVGAGGIGATTTGPAGGGSSFGSFITALGGDGGNFGGPAVGNGGAANTSYGSLYFGGNGGTGRLVNGDSAPNDQQGAPGGGAGGGYNGGNGGAGGAGSWRATAVTGGGGAGGATGTNGSPGVLPTGAEVYLGPGFGGGGGGGASTGNGGNGAAGILGGGGGGGGAIGTSGTVPGNGGNGGDGRVWVLEYY